MPNVRTIHTHLQCSQMLVREALWHENLSLYLTVWMSCIYPAATPLL